MNALDIRPAELPPDCEALRAEVRSFLAKNLTGVPPEVRAKSWTGYSPEFSRALGAQGWIGMTWPRRYGGSERSMLQRYVVLEELLAAGAPVGAHWVSDRQSGPLLMRYSPEVLAPELLPRMARGECYFCIGMSEPDSGSDLASIRSRATRDGDEWVLNGRKVWTSCAHTAHYMITLVRTSAPEANRHAGMSQFLVDMRTPGLSVRPIYNLLGEHEFNEVVMDDVRVPAHHLIGQEGEGWHQVTTELSFERSGPERYMSSTQLMLEMLQAADASNPHHTLVMGRLVAQYATLRQMSLGVAGMLHEGKSPALAAAAVKDQGALLEQSMPELAHELFGGRVPPDSPLARVQQLMVRSTPSFSLRGGTREVLRGILAKGLGLR